jgi:hypothetical protein
VPNVKKTCLSVIYEISEVNVRAWQAFLAYTNKHSSLVRKLVIYGQNSFKTLFFVTDTNKITQVSVRGKLFLFSPTFARKTKSRVDLRLPIDSGLVDTLVKSKTGQG